MTMFLLSYINVKYFLLDYDQFFDVRDEHFFKIALEQHLLQESDVSEEEMLNKAVGLASSNRKFLNICN